MKWSNLLCEKRAKDVLPNPDGSLPKGNDQGGMQEREAPRSEFQRDYDRTLFSAPVRRLQDKAQVFPLEPNDSVRTRLTHSLEVSNIAKSIAARAFAKLDEKGELTGDEEERKSKKERIRVVSGTCGLMHDLGNPPFGHAGEEAMRGWFQRRLAEKKNGGKTLGQMLNGAKEDACLSEDFLRFDGNAQTIRLVTKLQMLADFSGLNLTLGTLSAALKYTARADETNDDIHHRKKPGYFSSERDIVEVVRDHTKSGKSRNPIALIAEASDDIVYSVVDIEDGIKKRVLSWRKLRTMPEEEDWKKSKKEAWDELVRSAEENIEGRLKKAGLEDDMQPQALAEARAKIFRTVLIREHVNAAVDTFVKNYESIMKGDFDGELLKKGATGWIVGECKTLAREYIFTSAGILRLESLGRRVINDLMDIFWEGVRDAPYDLENNSEVKKEFSWKAYRLMSKNYRMVFEHNVERSQSNRESVVSLPVEYHQLQLVADYICGMTDNFARSLHQELTNR